LIPLLYHIQPLQLLVLPPNPFHLARIDQTWQYWCDQLDVQPSTQLPPTDIQP
jgi:hypothetical protein